MNNISIIYIICSISISFISYYMLRLAINTKKQAEQHLHTERRFTYLERNALNPFIKPVQAGLISVNEARRSLPVIYEPAGFPVREVIVRSQNASHEITTNVSSSFITNSSAGFLTSRSKFEAAFAHPNEMHLQQLTIVDVNNKRQIRVND